MSGGPNIRATAGSHQRSTASCAICRCSGVPSHSARIMSYPCRTWKASSWQTRSIARAYGPYEVRHSGAWLITAAPSVSQAMAPVSAQVSAGWLKVAA